jgi:flagellar assembly protein FliH
MSSSPRQAPDTADPESTPLVGEPFLYDVIPASAPNRASGTAAGIDDLSQSGGREADAAVAAREAQIRAEARREGQAEARKSFDEQLTRERAHLADALVVFTGDRAAYFQKVEAEVVQLALSIARKVLHREAQVDPLLLAGIVRVALEKIDGATGVRLRIHPQSASDWRRYLTANLQPADMPEIVEDPAQQPDCCTLETSMGTASIGLESQLKEIEQGLMDLLAARPGAVR